MSKSLFNVPTGSDLAHFADFAELQCLRAPMGKVSVRDLEGWLGQASESDDEAGIEDERPASVSRDAEAAFVELAARQQACGPDGYPFDAVDGVLTFRADAWSHPRQAQYLFMLVATRNNMNTRRTAVVQSAEVDGTELFEEVSARVALKFIGGTDDASRCGFRVVGTARRQASQSVTSYRSAIEDLCRCIGEGGGYKQKPDTGKPQDDGLDIAVWKSFSDGQVGKLVVFGQCKTGDSWGEGDITRLDPQSILSMRTQDGQFCHQPMRAFFATKRVSAMWPKLTSHQTLLFDRCRIVDYSDAMSSDLVSQCAGWAQSVMDLESGSPYGGM